MKEKATVTMYIYMVTVEILDIYKALQGLTCVFFYAILCKFLHFLYFRPINAIVLRREKMENIDSK